MDYNHLLGVLKAFAYYHTLARGKLANLANRKLFAKIFLAIIHSYTENVFGICDMSEQKPA